MGGKGAADSSQSGQPGSPYYGNLIASWSARESFQLAFTRAAVDAHATHRLSLRAPRITAVTLEEFFADE